MPADGRTWRTYSALLSDIAQWAGEHQPGDKKYLAEFTPHEDEDALLERFTQALNQGNPEAQAVLAAQNVSPKHFRYHLRYIARWSAIRRRLLAEGGNFQLLEGLNKEDKKGQLDGLVLKGRRVVQERALGDHLRRHLPVPKGEGWLAPIANPGKPVREYKKDEVVWLYPAGELQQADDLHPSVARSLIRRYLPKEGIVVDPMAGSGTIARMAALMGHRAWASDSAPREPYIALHDIHRDSLTDLFGDEFRVPADLVFVHPPTPEELGLTGGAYLDWLTQVLKNCWGAIRKGGHVVLVIGVTEKAGVLARAERALVDSANEAFEHEGLEAEVDTLTAQHLAASKDGTQGWHILVLQRPKLESDAVAAGRLFTLTISGVHDLPDLTDVDAVVSIRDPDDGVPSAVQASGARVFDLAFHDVLGEPVDRDVTPEAWHLQRLAKFLDEVEPHRVHVHCFYGVSRSAAVACFLLVRQFPEWTDKEVLEAVLAVRPEAQPNPLLLALVDNALGRDLSGTWQDLNHY